MVQGVAGRPPCNRPATLLRAWCHVRRGGRHPRERAASAIGGGSPSHPRPTSRQPPTRARLRAPRRRWPIRRVDRAAHGPGVEPQPLQPHREQRRQRPAQDQPRPARPRSLVCSRAATAHSPGPRAARPRGQRRARRPRWRRPRRADPGRVIPRHRAGGPQWLRRRRRGQRGQHRGDALSGPGARHPARRASSSARAAACATASSHGSALGA